MALYNLNRYRTTNRSNGIKMIGYAVSVVLFAAIVVPQVSCNYQFPICAKNWQPMSCRIDTERGMTTLFDDRKDATIQSKINWDTVNGNVDNYKYNLKCRCRARAIELKNTWFALENSGLCFSGPGSVETWLAKYKPAGINDCVGDYKPNGTVISDIDGEVCIGGVMRAYFFKILNPDAPAGSPAENEAEAEESVACQKVSDVVLVVDVSGSIGSDNFIRVKEFLQKLVDRFDFGSGKEKSRLGVVTFDDSVYLQMTWVDSEALTKAQIRDKIDNLEYKGGSTATDKALKFVINSIIQRSQRPNVPKTVFVLTDGKCFRGHDFLPEPSQQLRGLGAKVITIGIGNDVDQEELEIMTGNKNFIFLYSTFQNLIDVAVRALNEMIGKSCL